MKRAAERGHYDRSVIDPIIDEAIVSHVATLRDGIPMAIPTLHARIDDHLVIHGSPASQMLRSAKFEMVSVTITLIDGFVLARSAFHHSMNYRSVVIVGRPEPVPAHDKAAALDALTDKLIPGRLPFLRPTTDKELNGTSVLQLPISEASAKIRTGPPNGEADDYDLPIWAGVLPITTSYGPPIDDPRLRVQVDVPDHVTAYRGP